MCTSNGSYCLTAGNVPYSLNIGVENNVICKIVLEYFVSNPMLIRAFITAIWKCNLQQQNCINKKFKYRFYIVV